MTKTKMFDTFPEKILSILGDHGPLLHHQIVEIQKVDPNLNRSSSKTFYIAYKHLLKAGWIQKISISQEIIDQTGANPKVRHYLGYKITEKGRIYLRTKEIQQSLGKHFDDLLDNMMKKNSMVDTTQIIQQSAIPLQSNHFLEKTPEPPVIIDDFQDEGNAEMENEPILNEDKTTFITMAHAYPGRSTSELIEMLGSNEDVVNYELILSELLKNRKITAEERNLLLKKVIKIPNIIRMKYCIKEIQPQPRELVDLFFLVEKDDTPRIEYLFEEILNSKQSETDKIDFFESFIISKRDLDINTFIRLNFSQYSLIGLAHLHQTKPKIEIRDLIIQLLLKKIEQLDIHEKEETQVDLLEYAIKTEYFTQKDLNVSSAQKEILNIIPLNVFLYLTHIKLQEINESGKNSQQDHDEKFNLTHLFMLCGLTTKKLCLANDYDWDHERIVKGQKIVPKVIVDKYTTTFRDLPESSMAILLDFYIFLIKNNRLSYPDYLITLRLLTNFRMWDQLYSLIDAYLPKNLRDLINLPPGKRIHDVILHQIPEKFDDLKLILIQALNEEYKDNPETFMNLEHQEKWNIFSWINLYDKLNTLKFEKLNGRLEEYSVLFQQNKAEYTNETELYDFYEKNLTNEEELIIFTPYFARWVNANRYLGKDWALKILHHFVNIPNLIQNYRNIYLQSLELLIKWEIDPKLIEKWKSDMNQQLNILRNIEADFKNNL